MVVPLTLIYNIYKLALMFQPMRVSETTTVCGIKADSSPVVFMLRNARGKGARGVIARGDAHHTSRSRAARVAQHEDDWGRVMDKGVGEEVLQ